VISEYIEVFYDHIPQKWQKVVFEIQRDEEGINE